MRSKADDHDLSAGVSIGLKCPGTSPGSGACPFGLPQTDEERALELQIHLGSQRAVSYVSGRLMQQLSLSRVIRLVPPVQESLDMGGGATESHEHEAHR